MTLRTRNPYYTPTEDALIRQMAQAGKTLREIATATGRPLNGIRHRVQLLKIETNSSNKDNTRWTDSDDAMIAEISAAGGTVTQAADALGRTPGAVMTRSRKIKCPLVNDLPSSWPRPADTTERETLWGNISLASHRLPLNQIAQALAA